MPDGGNKKGFLVDVAPVLVWKIKKWQMAVKTRVGLPFWWQEGLVAGGGDRQHNSSFSVYPFQTSCHLIFDWMELAFLFWLKRKKRVRMGKKESGRLE